MQPDRGESLDFDGTSNVFIEGDNLEVLKLLQRSYFGKVKMIYIDPPYNTGQEFIYPDKYAESLETYLAYTGQIDSEARRFSTNTDTVGRYHSNWLNMMYSRLYLARNLLRDDGAIFVSIDDHEFSRLRELCDQGFRRGEFQGRHRLAEAVYAEQQHRRFHHGGRTRLGLWKVRGVRSQSAAADGGGGRALLEPRRRPAGGLEGGVVSESSVAAGSTEPLLSA